MIEFILGFFVEMIGWLCHDLFIWIGTLLYNLLAAIGHGLMCLFTLNRVKADDDAAAILGGVFLAILGLGVWLAC
jgi:hypothetical protein